MKKKEKSLDASVELKELATRFDKISGILQNSAKCISAKNKQLKEI